MLIAFRDKTQVSLHNEKEEKFNDIKAIVSKETHVNNPFTSSFLKNHKLSEAVKCIVQKFIAESLSPGKTLIELLQLPEWLNDDKSAAIAVLQLCLATFDRDGIICAYKSDRLNTYKSQIRKVILRLTFFKVVPILNDH